MILLIDNYDSFVFNVARYFIEIGAQVEVVRNDRIDLEGIAALRPSGIVLSPGPCGPEEAGVCVPAVRRFSGQVPLLGICLGHQCIGAALGGRVTRAREPMHGRMSMVRHDGAGIFRGLPNPLPVGRYHSLVVELDEARAGGSAPSALVPTAHSPAGEIMAVAHRQHPTVGVQFHPESILSSHGHALFRNFLDLEVPLTLEALEKDPAGVVV